MNIFQSFVENMSKITYFNLYSASFISSFVKWMIYAYEYYSQVKENY